jgi:hypothetical protein
MKGRKVVVILLPILPLLLLEHQGVKSMKRKVQQNGLDCASVLYVDMVGCNDFSKGMHATKHFVNTGICFGCIT